MSVNIEKTRKNIHVLIKNRTKVFFDGPAYSLTSVNDTGVFDILPTHANFVSIIRDYIVIDKGLPTEKKFEIKNGVLSILSNNINVYLEIL